MSPRILSVALFAAALTTAGYAKDDSHLEEITVRGQYLYADRVNALKTPTPVLDVPQSLSIISAEQINDQGFTSVGDIINYTPGVSTSQGEGHRDSVVFRGVRSTADFYIDGMRDDVQYYRPLYNLEQVEIIRGPNALLFGRGGTGGILNRVTKKGVVGDQFTDFKLSVNSFGANSRELDVNFDIGDNAAFRINLFFEDLNNHRDFFDGDNFGINPSFKIELSPKTSLDLSYEYADHERFIDRGIPAGDDNRPVDALEDVVFGDPELNTTTLTAHLLRATLQHQFSDTMKANLSAFYGDYDKLYQNFFASDYDESTNIVTLDGYRDPTDRQNLILSGNLISQVSTGDIEHNLLVGLEYIDTASDNLRFDTFFDITADDNETFFATRPLGLSNGIGINAAGVTTSNDFTVDLNRSTEVDIEVTSIYLQDEIDLTNNFKAVLGARFDSFDIDVFNVVANDNRNRKDEEISPRAGLIYKPRENISIYAGYSESFLPRSGEQFRNINGDNDALAPNTFENLEVGIKWDLSPDISVTAALFEIEESSPQPSDNDSATLDVIDTTTEGFEIQAMGHLTDRWAISGGYSYLDGNQINDDGSEGNRKRELPMNSFSLWNNYQFNDRLGFGLGVVYQDEYFATNSGASSTTVPDFTRVDAAVFYDFSDKIRVQLNVENLTDELYYPNSHSTHQITVGEPINARLTIIGRF